MCTVKFEGLSVIIFHGLGPDKFPQILFRAPCERSLMSTLEEAMQYAEKPRSFEELTEKRMYFDEGDGAVSDIFYPILEKMVFEHNHNALNVLEKLHSRYPRDPKISQLLEKIKRILGFLLGVVVLFIYQYLMGYVETGRWNTYSNGAWEFRATYVCIELRLGSCPFQKV
jgi:hypothetical protein